MSTKEMGRQPEQVQEGPSQTLAAPAPAAALRNAVALWAEQSTRPETLDRKDKLRDKM
jgi:hypothetical protein